MERFQINDPSDWLERYDGDQLHVVPAKTTRKVCFDVISAGNMTVIAKMEDREMVIGYGIGHLRIELVVKDAFDLLIVSEAGCSFVRFDARSQAVSAQNDEKFTTIEMRRKPNPEFERLRILMEHNAAINRATMQDAMDRMGGVIDGLRTKADTVTKERVGALARAEDEPKPTGKGVQKDDDGGTVQKSDAPESKKSDKTEDTK